MIPRRNILAVLASLVLTHKSIADDNAIRSLSRLIESLNNVRGRVEAIGRSLAAERKVQDLGMYGLDKAKEIEHYQELTISNYELVEQLFNNFVERILFDLDHSKSEFSTDWYEDAEEKITKAYQALVDSYSKAGIQDPVATSFLTSAVKVVLEALFGISAGEIGHVIADVNRQSTSNDSYKKDAAERLKSIKVAPYSSFLYEGPGRA
jgi:hypothetical protein